MQQKIVGQDAFARRWKFHWRNGPLAELGGGVGNLLKLPTWAFRSVSVDDHSFGQVLFLKKLSPVPPESRFPKLLTSEVGESNVRGYMNATHDNPFVLGTTGWTDQTLNVARYNFATPSIVTTAVLKCSLVSPALSFFLRTVSGGH